MNPLEVQVGGNHYKGLKIQPVEFISQYHLPYCSGNVVKYLTRNKGNRKEDLEKAYHYIDLEDRFVHVMFAKPTLEKVLYDTYKEAPFFAQFKNGKRYAQVLFYLRVGKKAKAKELLRKFINSGEYSEV